MKKLLPVIVVMIIAVAASFFIYKSSTEKYSTWTSTEGIIQKTEYMRKHNIRVCYTYEAEGKVYSGSEVIKRSSLGEGKTAGSKAEIWYDSENPAQSMYLKPSAEFNAMAPMFLVMPICIIIVMHTMGEKRR